MRLSKWALSVVVAALTLSTVLPGVASAKVRQTAPRNISAPYITGTTQVGKTLTANPGTWSGNPAPTYSYRWSDGTTGQLRALVSADVGKTFRVTVTARNSVGSRSATSAAVGPVTQPPGPPPPPGTCQGYVGLTFDDGPTSMTSQYLSALNAGGAHATFFLVGEQQQQYPGAASSELAAGNAIGDHTMDHLSFTGNSTGDPPLTDAQIKSEIQSQLQLTQQQTGFTETLIRPPYGDESQASVNDVASLGLTGVMWTIDPEDWNGASTSAIVNRVVSNAKDQSIALMHDGYSTTLNAIPSILSGLKAKGLCPGKIVGDSTNPNNLFDYNGFAMNVKVVPF